MDKTDDILERLKEWQPTLDNPDELTESIMANVKPRRSIRVPATVSSVAAILLIGFFLYQNRPSDETFHNYTASVSRGNTLGEVYARKQAGKKTISYTQFKKMLYENK